MIESTARRNVMHFAISALEMRIPYLWGGKSPVLVKDAPYPTGGLDCSGFITYASHIIARQKDLRGVANTDYLWTKFPRITVEELEPGDAVLYRGAHSTGPDDVEHMMMYAGRGYVIGQAYGGRANTTVGFSTARGMWTKYLPLDYRKDIAGFVRMPY